MGREVIHIAASYPDVMFWHRARKIPAAQARARSIFSKLSDPANINGN